MSGTPAARPGPSSSRSLDQRARRITGSGPTRGTTCVVVLRTDVALTRWADDHPPSQAPVGLATALIVGVPAAIGGLPRSDTLLDGRVGGLRSVRVLQVRAGDVLGTPPAAVFDAVRLSVGRWSIVPLHIEKVRSTFFEWLPGAEPDSAFLVAEPKTTWFPQAARMAPA